MDRATLRKLRKMGVKMINLEGVEEVHLVFSDRTVKLIAPNVTILKMGGQKIYQIIAEREEEVKAEAEEVEISEEDIALVMTQTGASKEEVEAALRETGGDLAAAILMLRGRDK